jgi:hypothetical protein
MAFLLESVTECSNKDGVTQEDFSESNRDELIEFAIEAMQRADEECVRRTKSEARLAEVEQQLRWLKNQ